MTTPMPPNNTGDKTRKQLITILVLLVLIILAMVVFLFVKMSSDRGGDSPAAEASGSSSSENGDAQVQAQAEKAVVVYKQVLANPAPLQTFVGEVSPGGAMKYALVHLDDGCVPELVLNYGTSAMSAEINAIGVYGVDENGQEIQFQNSYHDGASSTGGVRRALQRATGQPGMFSFSAERGGRNQEDLLVTRQGNELVETPANPGAGEFEQFDWIPADNLDIVEAIAAGNDCAPGSGSGAGAGADGSGADGASGANGGPNPTAGQQAAGSGSNSDSGSGSQSGASDSSPQGSGNGTSGQQTVTGTVKIFQNRAEVLAYQQREDPNPHIADDRQFAILVLDQPTAVAAKLAGSNESETRTIDHVVINPNLHSDGEKATISFSTDKTYWPSDTGIPFGLAVEDGAKG